MSSPLEFESQSAPAEPRAEHRKQALISGLYGLLGGILIGLIGWYYFQASDTEQMGFTHDDGVYAIAGKALALGKGFKLLHVVGEPSQIKYPVMYPLILSAVWKAIPQFPQNLPWMHLVTILFTVAGCGLGFFYLWRFQKFPGWLALLITAMIPSNFFFIYFFSDVMSEGPFLFFTMLTLCFLYWRQQKEPILSPSTIVILSLLSVVSFHTRVLGLALMLALGTWLLLHKQWKNALIYGAICFLLGLLPWSLWVKFNTPAITPMNYPLINTYSNYGLEFFHNATTSHYWRGIANDFFSLIIKGMEVTFPLFPNLPKIFPAFKRQYPELVDMLMLGTLIASYLLFGYFLLQVIHTLKKSVKNGQFQPDAFSVPGLYLFYYVLIITLWNYDDQMSRFLTPLLPLIWLYFFKPWLQFLPDFGKPVQTTRFQSAVATVLVLVLCTLSLWPVYGSYRAIYVARHQHWVESGKYRWMWGEYKQVFSWVNRSLPKQAPLAAASDVVFYLYTDHPTYYTFFASLRRERGRFTPDSIPLLMQSLDHYGVKYLVAEPHMQSRTLRMPVNVVAKQLLEKFPERFKHVFASPRGAINIYEIIPKNLARKPHPQHS